MTNFENDPHEIAEWLDCCADEHERSGLHSSARNAEIAAQMLHELWEQNAKLRAENERLKNPGRVEWIEHGSYEPPQDLAPAQLVEAVGTDYGVYRARVDRVEWNPGLRYRSALSANGDWLCSAEGLDPRARYVAHNGGSVCWSENKPILSREGLWTNSFGKWCDDAPETHRKPGPASESLMEVSRD